MKSGIKLLVLAISCLTLASGCTKKNSSSSKAAPKVEPPAKVEEKKEMTGPIKEQPKPQDPKADDSSTTPTPPPTDDSNKNSPATPVVQPPATGAETPTPTPAPTVTVANPPAAQPAQPAPLAKTDVQIFEECVNPLLVTLLNKEFEKNKELISPKKLSEVKQTLLKQCQKPTSISADQVNTLVNKKIADAALPKFSKSKEEIDVFVDIEESALTDNDRKQAYDEIEEQIQADMSAAAQSAGKPTVTPQPVVVPQAPAQGSAAAPVAPKADAAKPAAAKDQKPVAKVEPQKKAEPAKADASKAGPVAAAKPEPTKAEPAKATAGAPEATGAKDAPAVATFKTCYTDLVKTGLNGMKAAKEKIVPAGQLFEMKLAASAMCSRSTIKDETLDIYINQITADLTLKTFPEAQTEVKIFTETEAKKLDIKAKRKIYSDLAKGKNGAQKTAAKPAAGKTADKPAAAAKESVELKDLASFEKCLNENIESLFKTFKETSPEIESPAQLAVTEKILQARCKFKQDAKSEALILKVINEKVTTTFPNSKSSLEFYNIIVKTNLMEELKIALLRYYNIPYEYKFINTKISGVINPAQTSGDTITYTIKKLGGEIQSTVSPEGKEVIKGALSLDKVPVENVSFAFNVKMKENNMGSLTIIENSVKYPLEFSFVEGNSAQLKAKQKVSITFSQDSWNQVMEGKVRHTMGMPKTLVPNFPFKYAVENQTNQPARLCELSPNEIHCTDPDTIVRFKITRESLK